MLEIVYKSNQITDHQPEMNKDFPLKRVTHAFNGLPNVIH